MKRWKTVYRELPLQEKLFLLGITPSLPLIVLFFYIYNVTTPSREFLAMLGFVYLLWVSMHFWVIRRTCHEPFHILANQVRSIHQGDYTQRLISYSKNHAIGFLHDEINTLADELQNNRLSTIESNRRFQYLIDQLEIGVISFDEKWTTTLVNHHLARHFNQNPTQLNGKSCNELGLEGLREASSGRTIWITFPKKSSRYVIHANDFRDDGRPQHLFLLTDVNTQLREEERLAWQRLIRVLGHELNNSLTPIISLSNSLKTRIQRGLIEENTKESIEALEVISKRAEGMNRFVNDYSKLAKLPKPNRQSLKLSEQLNRVKQLLSLPALTIHSSGDVTIMADPDQIEHLFINVLKNADQAINQTDGKIELHWKRESTDVVVTIDDNGPGIEKLDNLFVPFFSTKPGGSGIGLVLSRQIAEANGGALDLVNREQGGCRVIMRLPVDTEAGVSK